MSRLKKRLLLVGSLLAVGFAAVGIAVAAIPDGNTISGCYSKITGALRVIDTAKGQKCFNFVEVPLAWNQVGPKGDQGIQGIKGDKGDTGQRGPAGPGGALAFGYVNADGTIRAELSSAGAGTDWDVARIGTSEPFVYCVRGPVGFKLVMVSPVNQDPNSYLDDKLTAPQIRRSLAGADQPDCQDVDGIQTVKVSFPDDDTLTDYVAVPFEIVFY
jgi:hypothetical protein